MTKKLIGKVSRADLINKKKRCFGHDIKTHTMWALSGLIVLFVCGLCLSVVFWFTNVFDDTLKSQLVLTRGSIAHENWSKPAAKARIGVHIFNYTNVDDFQAGRHTKLRVQDVGPYTYLETNERINQVFHGDGTVSYQERKAYEYSTDKSRGLTENDTLVVPNMPMLGAVSMHKDATWMTKMLFNGIFKGLNSRPFIKVSAKNFTWGYEDNFFSLVKGFMSFQKSVPFENFGILAGRTASQSNVYTVSTGEGDADSVQTIRMINGQRQMKHWSDECNHINGTDGSVFSTAAVRAHRPISIYHKDVCRKLPFVFHNVTRILGDSVASYRYVLSKTIFSRPDVEPGNQCYCAQPSLCPVSGVFDISTCSLGPVLLSLPHFLYGDDSLRQAVDGLRPADSTHSTYLDINPVLGFVMDGHSRFQINIRAHRVFGISQTDVFREDVVLPVAWFDVGIDEDELPVEVVDIIYRVSLTVPRIEQAVRYGSPLLCVVTLVVMAMLVYDCRSVKRSRRHLLQRNQSAMDALIP